MKKRLACLLALFLAGCANSVGYLPAGKSFGQIVVGKARVSTRERLINDRLEEDAWLRAQLRDSDNKVFGVQGKADIRAFTGLVARAGVAADAGQVKTYREKTDQQLEDLKREREIKSLDFQIALQKKQKELADTANDSTRGNSTYYGKGAGVPGGDAPKPPTPSVESTKQLTDLAKAYQDLQAQLAALAGRTSDKAGEPVTSTANASPIDEFRERLAYREEIRSELIQNALDDAHDLRGNTLYRLSFDAGVVPDGDTSAWAMITVRVKPPAGQGDPAPERFAEIVNQRIQRHATEIGLAVADACKSANSRESAGACVKSLRNDILDQLLLTGEAKKRWFLSFLSLRAESRRRVVTDSDARDMADELVNKANASGTYTSHALGTGAAQLIRDHWAFKLGGGDDFLVQKIIDGKSWCEVNQAKRLLGFKNDEGTIALADAVVASMTIRGELYGHGPNRIRNGFRMELGTEKSCRDLFVKENSLEAWGVKEDNEFRMKRVSAYGATPKESVQRIAEVLSRREASEFALAMQAVGGSASIDGVLNFVRSNDALFHALRRQPLVVGFAGNPRYEVVADAGIEQDTSAYFGWIIGPRFELRADELNRQQVGFRHTPVQNNVAGIISVPATWKEIDLEIEKCWKSEIGTYGLCTKQIATVGLPADLLRAFDLVRDDFGRSISISPLNPHSYTIRPGESASLVIRGENLWRNATVLLGGQEADRIVVMPDMGGIVAHFRQVQPSGIRRTDRDPTVELSVSTSEGHIRVAEVKIDEGEPAKSLQWAVVGNRLGYPGGKVALKAGDRLPSSFHDLAIVLNNEDRRTSSVTVTDSGQVEYLTAAGSVRFTVPSSISGWQSGDRIRVGTVLRKVPYDSSPESSHSGNLIFYLSEDKAKASATYKVSTKDSKVYEFDVAFPERFRDAYPVIGQRASLDVAVIGKIGDDDKSQGAICRLVSKQSVEGCKFSIALPQGLTDVGVRIGNGPEKGFPDVILTKKQ